MSSNKPRNVITLHKGYLNPKGSYQVYAITSYKFLLGKPTLEQVSNHTFVVTSLILQVSCPHLTCKAQPLAWCNLSNGYLMERLHATRWKKAFNPIDKEEQITITIPYEEDLTP